MYFVVGPPKVFAVKDGPVVTSLANPAGDVIAILTKDTVQLWCIGLNTMCLEILTVQTNEGKLLNGIWRSDGGRLCVVTTGNRLITIDRPKKAVGTNSTVKWSSDPEVNKLEIEPFTKGPSGTRILASLLLSSYGDICCITSDISRLCVSTASGYLLILSWNGEPVPALLQAVKVPTMLASLTATATHPQDDSVINSLNCIRQNELAATLSDGSIAVIGLVGKQTSVPVVDSFTGSRTQPIQGIDEGHKAALNSRKGLLAVSRGCVVVLHDLYSPLHKKASLSLESWGWYEKHLGNIETMTWSPDEEVLAVGYSKRGFAVFHWTGACVMTSLPRSGCNDQTSTHVTSSLLSTGTTTLVWDQHGYHLTLSCGGSQERILQMEFAKSAMIAAPTLNRGPQVMLSSKKSVWIFRHPDLDYLKDNWELLTLPPVYYNVNCPIRYVAMSVDGQHIVVCGHRGCVLYNVQLKKWKLFGVQEQEAEIEVVASPVWCTNTVVCLPTKQAQGHALLFYPRFYLDRNSLLLTLPMDTKPELLDAAPRSWNDAEGIVSLISLDKAGKLHCFRIKVLADSVSRPSKVQLQVLSKTILTWDIAAPISALRLLPTPPVTDAKQQQQQADDRTPPSALVLTHRGELALINFSQKWKSVLSRNVSSFWIDPSLASHGFVHLIISSPKKTVMLAILHPNHKRQGAANVALRRQKSKELVKTPQAISAQPAPPHTTTLLQDADTDACPIGVLTGEGLLISATEGVRFSANGHGPPSYHVHVRTIPYLHAVLMALFIGEVASDSDATERAACSAAAVEVAKGLHEHSFFVDVMDYLLHSVLHCHDIVESHSHHIERSAVLRAVLSFLSNYPEFHEVLVHCLRKADPGMWPLVFAQCPPLQLFDSAVYAGRITEAALLLRVLQMPVHEDPSKELRIAASAARKLFPLAISRHKFELSAELLRFLKLLRGELLSETDDYELRAPKVDHIEAGLVPQGSTEDPLLESSLLRGCVVAEGRKMLEAGSLRDLRAMLDLLGLSATEFVRKNWVLKRKSMDLEAIFLALHTQFGLPLGSNAKKVKINDKGLTEQERTDKILSVLCSHSRLLHQLKHSSNVTRETQQLISRCCPYITPTQIHLLLVPAAHTLVTSTLEAVTAAQCHEYTLLLSLILLDVATVSHLLTTAPHLKERVEACLQSEHHIGYKHFFDLAVKQQELL
eukprot:TRINITY_DN33862_c0_g1_i1.p1 TRINITY_DN33862_c0_g1~~TRINITY_DN33862_c0_g1_i1.p1  ORF type:complete len:1195 (+),score=253.97 TRINITY_DN33862_c0_g1_i1:100-3684(+)